MALAAVKRWLAWELGVNLEGWCGLRGETDEGVARKLDAVVRVLMVAGAALRGGDYGESDLSLRAVAGAARALCEVYYEGAAGARAARSEGSATSAPGRSAAGARATSVRGQQEGSGRGLAAGVGSGDRTHARAAGGGGGARAGGGPASAGAPGLVASATTVVLTGVPVHWKFWETRKFVHRMAQMGAHESVYVVDERGSRDGHQRVKLASAAAGRLVQAIRGGVYNGSTRIGIGGVGPARASGATAAEAAAAARAAASTANATGRGGGDSEAGKLRKAEEAAEEAGRPGDDAEVRAASDGEAAVELWAAAAVEAGGGAGGGGPAAAAAAVVAGAAEGQQGAAAGAVVEWTAAAEQERAAGESKEGGDGGQEEESGAQQQDEAWLEELTSVLCELNEEQLLSVGQEVSVLRKRGSFRERPEVHARRIAAWAAGGAKQRAQLQQALRRTETEVARVAPLGR